jgi:hypothetical protein
MNFAVIQAIYFFSHFRFTSTQYSVQLLCLQNDLFHMYGGNSAALL